MPGLNQRVYDKSCEVQQQLPEMKSAEADKAYRISATSAIALRFNFYFETLQKLSRGQISLKIVENHNYAALSNFFR